MNNPSFIPSSTFYQAPAATKVETFQNNILLPSMSSFAYLTLNDMEFEIFRSLNSPRYFRSLSSSRFFRGELNSREPEANCIISQYTSLKDILYDIPTRSYCEGYDFDSNIPIKNELVKRAASHYLQSAALLATRNQNCFEVFWERLRIRAASACSCWRRFSGNPMRACLWPIFQFLNHMMRSVRSLH